MSPYPFGPKLSFRSFQQLLERQFGCSLHPLVRAGELADVNGSPTPAVSYFEREVEGERLQAIVVVFDEGQYMTPTVIRSTCAALRITDLSAFEPYL